MRIHPTVKGLLDDIDAFCAARDMAPTTFSKRVTGDGHLVRRLRRGLQPTLRTIDKVRRYIKQTERDRCR